MSLSSFTMFGLQEAAIMGVVLLIEFHLVNLQNHVLMRGVGTSGFDGSSQFF
jgi:hypothetical protein